MAGHRGETSSVGGMAGAKRQNRRAQAFRRPFGGTVAALGQLSAGLEFKPHCVGVGTDEGVLAFRKTF